MKAVRGLLGLALLSVGVTSHARVLDSSRAKNAPKIQAIDEEAVPGEFVIQMKPGQLRTQSALSASLASLGFSLKSVVNAQVGIYSVRANRAAGLHTQALRSLSAMPGVQFAEPNYIYRAMGEFVPNDARFSELWGMRNTGQIDGQGERGRVGADIKAPEAWAIGSGPNQVVLAVVDTGIDYNHPDLRNNVWTKTGSPTDAPVHGYNAITGALNPMDDNSHGTHCSGTIGAKGNDGVGVAGIAWNVQIMGAKFLGADGGGNLEDAIKAIDWAVTNGAKVLSNSWGGGGYSDILKAAIQRSADAGAIFVAAAGNDAFNNDSRPTYPASYLLSNMIVVAASNNRDELASFSNYGARSVHIMAPGDGILSTIPDNKYAVYSGTSMATPHVAGAVALLLSREPNLTAEQVRNRLMSSADKIKAVRSKLISGGRLNLFNLLANIDAPGFFDVPEAAWSALVPNAISTAHPYGLEEKKTWEISHPGARFIRLHFPKFALETRYDTLKITNVDTGEVETLTGTMADNSYSSDFEGSHLKIEFETDGSVTEYGFDIDGYQWTNYGP